MDRKSEFLTSFGINSIERFSSGIQGCDELRKIVNVLVSMIFHIAVKYIFQGSYCKLSKCSLSLTHCRVNLYSFSSAKFFKISSIFRSFVDPNLFESIFFRNPSQKITNRFFRIFCFYSLCIYGFMEQVLTK